MKHPLKRFMEDKEVPTSYVDKLQPEARSIRDQERAPKDYGPVLIIDNGTEMSRMVRAFEFQAAHNNKINIPEPDLSVVYFHMAYYKWKHLREHRDELIGMLSGGRVSEDVIFKLYDWFGNSAMCLISLWLALETSVNRHIKPDSRYLPHGKEDKVRVGEEIVPMDTKEKLRYALPQLIGRDYREQKGHQFDFLMQVKTLRDEFVHPKRKQGQSMHDHLYINALRFKYDKAFEVVKGFINFYEGRDLITDCTCNNPA